MKLSPEEIEQQQFRVRFRGFDVAEVDRFLEQMADEVRSIHTQNRQLTEEVQRIKAELRTYKERENAFKQAMANSKKVVEQLKENARKSAQLIIADAEVRAEKILNRAHNRLAQLHEDIGELKRQRMQIEVQIRSVIEAHTKQLELSKEEMQRMDEQDSKVAILKKS